ncbi:hypothetical protein FB451DRAFT_1415884 [Mycena latifolia]|nr:hypothetical protein FB451DRAFT_1415884 [Mycena latifolia]
MPSARAKYFLHPATLARTSPPCLRAPPSLPCRHPPRLSSPSSVFAGRPEKRAALSPLGVPYVDRRCRQAHETISDYDHDYDCDSDPALDPLESYSTDASPPPRTSIQLIPIPPWIHVPQNLPLETSTYPDASTPPTTSIHPTDSDPTLDPRPPTSLPLETDSMYDKPASAGGEDARACRKSLPSPPSESQPPAPRRGVAPACSHPPRLLLSPAQITLCSCLGIVADVGRHTTVRYDTVESPMYDTTFAPPTVI